MADLNDVYAWMTSDGANLNLALTVSPGDNMQRSFGPSVSYQFHVSSRPGFQMPGMESKITCTFVSDTNGSCWVVNPSGAVVDYVTGDFSGATGRLSASGKFRVFAGRRSDPFFFNFVGFKRAVATAVAACGGTACPTPTTPRTPPIDGAGCLQIDKATGDALRGLIGTESTQASAPCPADQIDCFENFNVMAIVVQVDKTQVLQGSDKLVSVWASTHAAP